MKFTRYSEQAVALLRRRRITEAVRLFEWIERRVPEVGEAPPVGLSVFERFYYGARAYYFYVVEEYAAADEDLISAHNSVTTAVAALPFLIPFSQHAAELRLQRARVARNRNNWKEMREHVETARSMTEDQEPLCRLTDGTPVFFSTIAGLFAAVTSLTPEDRVSLGSLIDKRQRVSNFDLTVRWLYTLPGTVILYP